MYTASDSKIGLCQGRSSKFAFGASAHCQRQGTSENANFEATLTQAETIFQSRAVYWLFFLPCFLFGEITALYLSWYDDPTTTMTIQWHTPPEEYGDTIYLHQEEGTIPLSGSHEYLDQVLIHSVALENLQPNTEYSFTIDSNDKVYKFRTAPTDLTQPLRFIVGGDLYASKKLFRRMSQTVLEHEPHFIVLGGDLAYAIGAYPFRSSLKQWLAFLKDWKDFMIGKEGHIIPFLITPGNHDITPDNYETFFRLFAFPQRQLYRAIDFGSYLSLILLDTGHFHPIEGRQTHWLDKALSKRTAIPYRFAIYHEAAYPSYYSYLGKKPKKIRTFWTPLFDQYNLLAAFENHNHAFKRTHPLRANQIHPNGVVYFGDGNWGAPPRNTKDSWYLATKAKRNNVFLIELTNEKATVQAFDLLNHLIDEVSFGFLKEGIQ